MSVTLIWPFRVMLTEKPYMTYYNVFHTNFLTLKMTFRVSPYLSYFRTGLVSQQRNHVMQSIWTALRYYWIIMGKWAKSNLADLDNNLLNKSITSISWQLINFIPKKLYAKNKEKLSDHFWENLQKKSSKTAIFDIFRTFRTLKLYSDSIESTFWQFISILLGKLQVKKEPNLTFLTF